MSLHRIATAGFLLFATATLCNGQSLGELAARERAKREKAEAKKSSPVYTNESLPASTSPNTPKTEGDNPTSLDPSAPVQATGSTAAEPKVAESLPQCSGGSEMLLAWSSAREDLGRECSGGPLKGTEGRFEIVLTLSGNGTVEGAVPMPENAYTTCLAGKLRGRSLPKAQDGKRCQTTYTATWRL